MKFVMYLVNLIRTHCLETVTERAFDLSLLYKLQTLFFCIKENCVAKVSKAIAGRKIKRLIFCVVT